MSKQVGIVLVNYQDYAIKYLADYWKALRQQDYPADSVKVYIVDNASTPESVRYLTINYPEAVVFSRPDGNYAAANNLGFSRAHQDGCEYIVSVNMDTVAQPNWLSELVLALENNPQAGLAQSKILLFPKNEAEQKNLKINSLGNIIHFLGFGYTSQHGQPDQNISDYPEIPGYASGCSFIIRSEVWHKVGGYNEEYYMYHDDLELSLKVKLAGQKIILAPQSVIYHKYEFSRSTKMIYYMERNRYLTLLIFYPYYFFVLIALPGLLMDIGMFYFSLINGWFSQELKIYNYFFNSRNYDKIYRERKRIKQFQVVPFSQIARHFSGRIEFQEIANPLLKYLVNPLFNLYWQIVKLFI